MECLPPSSLAMSERLRVRLATDYRDLLRAMFESRNDAQIEKPGWAAKFRAKQKPKKA